jgi:hypothetical protein
MGVDISGINPVVVSQCPDYPINWDNATQIEKEAYWKAVDEYKAENPGIYFSANWWSWRPIHMLCDLVSKKNNLRINTRGWGENSGYGLKNPQKCEELADALESHISNYLEEFLRDDNDRIYLCMGSWCTDEGKFLPQDVDDKLQQDYPLGTILYNGIVLEDGSVVYPSHGTSLGHLCNWIAFLRNCGGFEIY